MTVDPEIRELLRDVAMLRQEIYDLRELLQDLQNTLSAGYARFQPSSPKILSTN